MRTGNSDTVCYCVLFAAALYSMHFPLNAEGEPAPSQPVRVPHAPDTEKLKQDKLH